MSYQAIQAMLNVLHDKGHTRFLTPADVQAENQQLSGTFTGIGVYLRQDPQTKQLIITSPIPGSPAEKAGFKHGDIIIAVNGTSTQGKDIAGVSPLIQGTAGTGVNITIQRPSTKQTLTIHVIRAEIKVPNVIMHYIAQDHIADIQMVQFADGVSDQLKDAITQAKKEGATKIILDLRENPGGYLNEAINTASEFMKSGNVFWNRIVLEPALLMPLPAIRLILPILSLFWSMGTPRARQKLSQERCRITTAPSLSERRPSAPELFCKNFRSPMVRLSCLAHKNG